MVFRIFTPSPLITANKEEYYHYISFSHIRNLLIEQFFFYSELTVFIISTIAVACGKNNKPSSTHSKQMVLSCNTHFHQHVV